MTALDVIRPLVMPSVEPDRFYGVAIGVVTNNQDPANMHRVRVRFPWLSNEVESNWARVTASMAGNDRGTYFLPEVDDEVLVAFEHGRIDHPYVIGSLWNGQDSAPESNADGENNRRTIRSRSGHVLRLNDQSGSETIEIIDKSGNNKIIIATTDNSITIAADADITITSSTGKLTMRATGIEIDSKAGVEIKAASNMDLKANANMTVKGAMVQIN